MKTLITLSLLLYHTFFYTQQKQYTLGKGKNYIDNRNSSKQKEVFVLSCGSGCAMTYTPEGITGNLPDLKVKFKVEMYVDEQLSDTYNEIYLFSYNQSNQIENIHLEGKNDNVLKTLLPDAQRSFREFADELITNNDKASASESSKIIYNKKNDPKNGFL